MAVPDYQSFMLPFLEILGDKKEHSLQEMYERLADHFNLTEEDKKERVPSGKQLKYHNRISWARTYLKKAGLIKNVSRGKFVITERGLRVLRENLEKVDIKYLQQFEEFRQFRRIGGQVSENKTSQVSSSQSDLSPEEQLDESYELLQKELIDELLMTIKSCTPKFFEKLVIDLLVAMGYGGSYEDAGKAIGKSGDDGIDGIIKEDRLGLDVIYVQAKRWEHPVGRPTVQAFAGSLEGQRAKKGIIITTSRFTEEARQYVKRIEKRIVLLDGIQLAELMIDYNVGVYEKEKYVVKKMDLDYFEEG